jgi:hypothetical protein
MTEDELAQLEVAYERALRRACSERSPEAIADAFDEADRLQWRILVAGRRRRALPHPEWRAKAGAVPS